LRPRRRERFAGAASHYIEGTLGATRPTDAAMLELRRAQGLGPFNRRAA